MKRALWLGGLALHCFAQAATPCTGIDQSLSASQRRDYAAAIEQHLNQQLGPEVQQKITTKPQDVRQVFRKGPWHIVYVYTHVSDEPFLFYTQPPHQAAAYLTAWAGSATDDEGPSIRAWVRKNAPGIPSSLASCFAWKVTTARDVQ
ncbi:hypothetical protein ACDW_25380 [Acidovorax sp. DW039]|uniref:hypothetical protein n=1 Tax=Acidovorax sp. DW039 TaxID=3095606 RepID=UPI00308B63B4|nr:hypothetical protein ACDW_25380 [Acidovorax sp. DW039]